MGTDRIGINPKMLHTYIHTYINPCPLTYQLSIISSLVVVSLYCRLMLQLEIVHACAYGTNRTHSSIAP